MSGRCGRGHRSNAGYASDLVSELFLREAAEVDQIRVSRDRPKSPRGEGGAVIRYTLCHDGGGTRAQTVTALKAVLPQLRAEGLRFVAL